MIRTRRNLVKGGAVRGPGGPRDDKIPAMLSNGEYVLPADTVRAVGKQRLDALRASTHTFGGGMKRYADGGSPVRQRVMQLQAAGMGGATQAARDFATRNADAINSVRSPAPVAKTTAASTPGAGNALRPKVLPQLKDGGRVMKKNCMKNGGTVKKGVDKPSGKSNALGHGGRAAQLKRQGVPKAVIGMIARSKGAAPGQAHYHGGLKRR